MRSIGDLAGCAARHVHDYCTDPAYAWPAYDEDPYPTVLTAVDLLAPALLNARVSWRAALNMANHGNGDDPYAMLWDAMSDVVTDDLAHHTVFEEIKDLRTDPTWQKVQNAFECCQDSPEVKSTKVSKILHRKLPHLVPINDSWVRFFYSVTRDDPRELWPRLHADINHHRDMIDTLRKDWSTPRGRPMTRLRCADIVVWMHMHTGCTTGMAA